jgi:hypothetical protein
MELKQEIALQKAELAKIKQEIENLLAEKLQLAKDINLPVYKAKEEAEKILKDAKDEALITKSASDKILAEAQQTHEFAHGSLREAKCKLDKLESDNKKLEQDKIDFDGLKFTHENLLRNKRNEINSQEIKNREDSEILQQKLIEVKQREDSVARREKTAVERENSLLELNTTLETRKSSLDSLEAKLGLLEKSLAEQKEHILAKEGRLQVTKAEIEAIEKHNKALLEEAILRKNDLVNQQKSLAREIELLDNAKAEGDEQMKTLKEKERLIDMKLRQNEEKLATIKTLRGE